MGVTHSFLVVCQRDDLLQHFLALVAGLVPVCDGLLARPVALKNADAFFRL